jgi:hypothetical protein
MKKEKKALEEKERALVQCRGCKQWCENERALS